MSRTKLSVAGLAVAALLFVCVHVISVKWLTGLRLDLTEGGLYTLSDGSRAIAAGLSEPVGMKLYLSQRLISDIPPYKSYATRVRELLQEYCAASGGQLTLQVIEPEPFSEEEDDAVAAGLTGVPVNTAGDPLYFGLVTVNSVDESAVIPFFRLELESNLEYDISRTLYRLDVRERARVAVLSALPLEGGEPPMMPGMPPSGGEPWMILDQLRQVFDVTLLAPEEHAVPEGTDVLLLVHPKDLSPEMLFSIDQYVLAGGRVLAFVDPHCEADIPPHDPGNPLSMMGQPRGSDLGPLLGAWGLSLPPDKFVADRGSALSVRDSSRGRVVSVDYVAWMGIDPTQLDAEDVITKNVGALQMRSAGSLAPLPDSGLTVTPLIRSTDDAMEADVSALQFMPDPQRLLVDFQPSGVAYTLAARVRGPARTAFPDGPPAAVAEEDPETETEAPEPSWLSSSEGSVNLVVVADADMLADVCWVDVANFLGTQLAVPTSSNADFLLGALDNLSGSDDLISVPSRTRFDRPFERIDAIRQQAEQRLLAKQQELETDLRETEAKIRELEGQKSADSDLLLSPEQRDEIERFRDTRLAIRKDLREVQHAMLQDIERLQSQLKFANIGLVPIAVCLVAFFLWAATRGRGRSAA